MFYGRSENLRSRPVVVVEYQALVAEPLYVFGAVMKLPTIVEYCL
jgi:hypothetical protein